VSRHCKTWHPDPILALRQAGTHDLHSYPARNIAPTQTGIGGHFIQGGGRRFNARFIRDHTGIRRNSKT